MLGELSKTAAHDSSIASLAAALMPSLLPDADVRLVPSAERQRLRALAAYGLAGTAPEAEFDHFAAMAADLLDLPVGLVNLVGEDCVTVKGRSGLLVNTIPRDIAFCSHAILNDDVLSVSNLARDARFAANPLVSEENGFRFYAGAPLITPSGGHRVGTLCVAGRNARPVLDERETRLLAGLASLVMDRMDLRRAERARLDALAQFERMTDAAPGAVLCASSDGRITHWNPAAERLFGWPAHEAVGRRLEIIIPDDMRAAHAAGMARLAGSGNRAFPGRIAEMPALRRDGTTFPAHITFSCWYVGDIPVFGASIHDISARRAAEDRLRYLAHFDPASGLANRARLNELLLEASRGSDSTALVLLDLDGFKHVNDTLGHGAGDVLLAEVAGRLSGAVRDRGILARLGGDEFAVLCRGCANVGQAYDLVQDLQASLASPFQFAHRAVRLAAGAGIALAAASEAANLLANADLALHQAKAAGRGQARVFGPAMRQEHAARLVLEEEVGCAALAGEFELHYQPQICLSRGVAVGAEALLRWRHPKRGLLPPAVFLDALESGPLAGVVGDWAIEQGCRQAAAWRSQGLSLRVGVNLFAEQIRAGNLERTVRNALTRWQLPPSALELELTETIVLRNNDDLLTPLHALRAFGVGIALDDFGTGFASLSTLKHYPVGRLKIDRGFISDLGTQGALGSERDRGDMAVVDAVLALGRGFGLQVVAEGVETQSQADFLAACGCDEAQGYLYGRPVPASG